MEEDIRTFVRTCDRCQKYKQDRRDTTSGSAKIRPEPFAHIGLDIVGPLPVTLQGNRYLIVAVDFFTKWVEAEPLKEANAQNIAEFIHKEIICRHAKPQEITTDRGTEFNNQLIKTLSEMYSIGHIKTTAYHPQGNGQTERMNKTLKATIGKITKDYQHWDHYVPCALSALRTLRSDSTKYSPFELVYGRISQAPETYMMNPKSFEEEVWRRTVIDITRLHKTREKAAEFITKSQETQQKNANKDRKPSETLHIGDQVLLYRNIVEASWSRKLEPKWEGPFIVQKIKGTSHWLRRTTGTIIPTPVHRNRIKKYHDPHG